MMNRRLGWILTLALGLTFVSMEAHADAADAQAFFAELRSEMGDKPLARRPARPSGIAGEKATCTAQCGGGTSVTVNCSGTCTAVDRNCSVNQRGYAKCSGGSQVNCPTTCPTTCTAETPCPGGGSVWCHGVERCVGGPGFCYVECDGNFTWCPGTEPMISCWW